MKIKLVRGREYKYPKKHIPELCAVFEEFTKVAQTRRSLIRRIFEVIIGKENIN